MTDTTQLNGLTKEELITTILEHRLYIAFTARSAKNAHLDRKGAPKERPEIVKMDLEMDELRKVIEERQNDIHNS